MNSNNAGNRLHLNFGYQDRNNFPADQGRAFPTTPSTFPQPVYPNQAGQQEVWGQQQNQGAYGGGGGGAGAGFFMNNPYQSQYHQQQQQQQSNLQAPGSGYRAQTGYGDGPNGLANQLSHQHLGGPPRSGSPYGRQPSPSQRPRTAGATGQATYQGYFNTPLPGPKTGSLYDEEPPARNPDKYDDAVLRQAKVSTGLVSTFFKDSVHRARERNQRSVAPSKINVDHDY
jgi:protein-serine/threonine kinase